MAKHGGGGYLVPVACVHIRGVSAIQGDGWIRGVSAIQGAGLEGFL